MKSRDYRKISLCLTRIHREMFYQSDFRTLPARFQTRYDYQRSFKALRRRKLNSVAPLEKESKDEEVEKTNEYLELWFSFCNNTSVHGMKYLGQLKLNWTER